jgi:bromodomain-containing factor 1
MQNFETEQIINNENKEEEIIGESNVNNNNNNNNEKNENFAQEMTDAIYGVHATVNEALSSPQDVEMDRTRSPANETEKTEDFAPAADSVENASVISESVTGATGATGTTNNVTTTMNPHLVKEQIKYCQRILKGLKRHREAGPFLLPVDPVALNIPDYFTVIKQPMDLSTISKKLDLNEYATAEAFMADVRLMLTNCFTYNAPDSQVTKMGRNLEKYFNTVMAKMPTELISGASGVASAVGMGASGSESPTGTSRPKRESSVVAATGGSQIMGSQVRRASSPSGSLTFCSAVLRELMKKTNSHLNWPFMLPVDPVALNIPDYFDVIKQPMDLGTIRKKIDSGMYNRADQFESDVRLIFSNCYTYNPPESDVCKMARELESIFGQKMSQKPAPKAHNAVSVSGSASSSTSSMSHSMVPTASTMSQSASTASFHPLASQMIPSFDTLEDDSDKILTINRYIQMLQAELNTLIINRKPSNSSFFGSASGDGSSSMSGVSKAPSKPKAKKPAAPSALAASKTAAVSPVVDEMTFDEKRQLSEDVGNLQQENMSRVLEIIQECMPNLHSNGDSDVIELDIEALDVRTLRALQSYIWECQNPGKKRKVPSKPVGAVSGATAAPVKKPKNEELRTEAQTQNNFDSSSSSSSEDDE